MNINERSLVLQSHIVFSLAAKMLAAGVSCRLLQADKEQDLVEIRYEVADAPTVEPLIASLNKLPQLRAVKRTVPLDRIEKETS